MTAGGSFYYFKSYLPNAIAPQAFPQIEGEIQVDKLDGQVAVYRNAMGGSEVRPDVVGSGIDYRGYRRAFGLKAVV